MEIETIYGLCNRLQTLIGFYTYKKPLEVIWEKNDECLGDFLDFFEDIEHVNFIKTKTENFEGSFYIFNVNKFKVDKNIYKDNFINNHQIIRPKKIILDKVKNLEVEDMIGLHIRRTDFNQHIYTHHRHLVPYVNDKYFFNIINNILKENPSQKFFLATDNLKTQNFFCKLFPNNMVIQKKIKEQSQNRQTTFEESIIDLFALTNCKEFYGTRESSFTRFVINYRISKLKKIT